MIRLVATTDDGKLIYERFYSDDVGIKEAHRLNVIYVKNECFNRPVCEGGYGAINIEAFIVESEDIIASKESK